MGAHKGRSAPLAGMCAVVVIVVGLSGCGHGSADASLRPSGVSHSTSLEQPTTGSVQPGLGCPSSTAGLQPGETVTADWSTPNREILDAFARATEALGGSTAYFPSRLPEGARLLRTGEEHVGAQVVVSVATDGGKLEFGQVIKGDVGDLPAEAVTLGDGRSASVYQLMDGILVQWAEGADWYGVYATGFPRDEVVMVAELMEPW